MEQVGEKGASDEEGDEKSARDEGEAEGQAMDDEDGTGCVVLVVRVLMALLSAGDDEVDDDEDQYVEEVRGNNSCSIQFKDAFHDCNDAHKTPRR